MTNTEQGTPKAEVEEIKNIHRYSIFALRCSAVLLLCTGCTKLITVPIETAGKISCSAISATGKVAAETVKTGGKIICTGLENPDAAKAAIALAP